MPAPMRSPLARSAGTAAAEPTARTRLGAHVATAGVARGRQHRGLSLTTMAVGIAAVLLSLGYVFDVPGAFERGSDLDTEIGAWIGLLGGIIWSVGAGLLAKEPEGDDDWNSTETHRTH